MSLFEIDLNDNFKILGYQVFLSDEKLFDFYKKNKLHFSSNPEKDEIAEYLNETIKINGNKILLKQYRNDKEKVLYDIRYSNESIIDFFLKDIYTNDNSYHKVSSETLYPEWLLFFIAINKFEALQGFKNNFVKHIELFKYIAQIRYKKYIKYNIVNYVNDLRNMDELKDTLHDKFMEYLKDSEKSENELFEFLSFLNLFRREVKDIEKYKLMWNLETYIREVIVLLLDKNISTEIIYKKIGGGDYSELHEVHILKDLYIEESKKHFQQIFLPEIKKIFPNATVETVINYLAYKKEYENIILSYLEVIKYLNANKPNELIIGAMIRNMVLEIEEILKESTICNEDERNGLFCYLNKLTSKDKKLKRLRDKINTKHSKEQQLNKLENRILCEEESFEKYLMIFYHSRNYLAHNQININKLFWENERRIASYTINSVMIILYRIEMIKKSKA